MGVCSIDTVDLVKAKAVAQDVLDYLGYLHPAKGSYCVGDCPSLTNMTDQAQNHITTITASCRVCALGAMLLSYIRKYNHLTVDNITNFAGDVDVSRMLIVDFLEPIFGGAQLNLIEDAFEGWPDHPKTAVFCAEHPDPTERLRAIMDNIIQNEGVFKL